MRQVSRIPMRPVMGELASERHPQVQSLAAGDFRPGIEAIAANQLAQGERGLDEFQRTAGEIFQRTRRDGAPIDFQLLSCGNHRVR